MLMSISLAVIGAGQMGIRHLQGLAQLKRPARIFVIDPSRSSLKKAQAFFETLRNRRGHRVEFLQRLEDAPFHFDVTIVSTTARVRHSVIEQLLHQKRVRFLILEKFLFQKRDHFSSIGRLLEKENVPAWVNCPLRTMPFFKYLKEKIQGKGTLNFCVSGSNIGMATNSIHHLDVAAYLIDRYEWRLDGSMLDKEIQESKRNGFIEFTGTLSGGSTAGDHVRLTSYRTGQTPLRIQICTPKLRCLIDLNAKKAWLSEEGTQWVWTETEFSIPLQSERTHLVTEQILVEGFSDLPTYADSCRVHLPLLQAFLSHLRTVQGGDETCPIT